MKTSIYIENTLIQTAHEMGINISKTTTQALQNQINQQTTPNNQNNTQTEPESVVRLPGFEPGSSAWQEQVDWTKFRTFVQRDHMPKVARDLERYARRFGQCLIDRDFGPVQQLSDSMRPNALRGLSALSKFLGCYNIFRDLMHAHNLKWTGKSADDLIIQRLTHVTAPDEIWQWVVSAKRARPDLEAFLDLMSFTGLRLVEAVHSFNLVIKLSAENGLAGYYVHALSTLEHFKFKELFIRRSKKAFVSFVPEQLIASIGKQTPLTSPDAAQKLLQKKGLLLRFADIREAQGTLMNRYLTTAEIDFLHGRVTANVFMQHYFNPALIADLQTRVFKGIAEIQEKVRP